MEFFLVQITRRLRARVSTRTLKYVGKRFKKKEGGGNEILQMECRGQRWQRKAIGLINVPATTAMRVRCPLSLSLSLSLVFSFSLSLALSAAENYLSRSVTGEDYAKWRVIGGRLTETSFQIDSNPIRADTAWTFSHLFICWPHNLAIIDGRGRFKLVN